MFLAISDTWLKIEEKRSEHFCSESRNLGHETFRIEFSAEDLLVQTKKIWFYADYK